MLSTFQILWLVFMSVMHKKLNASWISTLVNIVTLIAFVLTLILATSVRFSHVGKVCSGDFNTDPNTNLSYLTASGAFLKVYLYTVYGFCGAVLLSPCLLLALAYCLVDF